MLSNNVKLLTAGLCLLEEGPIMKFITEELLTTIVGNGPKSDQEKQIHDGLSLLGLIQVRT
jgi:hypothetical protein